VALGFGHIDPAHPERNKAIDMDSKFRVASISKPVCALGAMILVDEGLLDLEADLSDYLGFAFRNPAFPDSAITAAMLLSHTSSLRDDDGYNLPFPRRLVDHVGPEASGRGHWAGAGDHADSSGRDLSPGSYFCYCNLNFGVLATLMERLSGKRFDLYMRERIFEPLGIDAGYNVLNLSDAGFARLSTLYRAMDPQGRWDALGPWYPQIDDYGGIKPACGCRLEEGHGLEEVEAYEPGTNGSLFGPQGGLRISARELGTILRLFLNSGEVDGVRLVSEHAIRLMMTSRWTWNPDSRNGSLYGVSTRESGLGLMRMAGFRNELGGDRLLSAGGLQPWCHHADAQGLLGGLAFDIAEGWGYVYLIGGTQSRPEKVRGSYSSSYRCEEEIQAAIVEECLGASFGATYVGVPGAGATPGIP
ncbi:MAG: serine hydrolase, partial [Spirochaetota bacterium]